MLELLRKNDFDKMYSIMKDSFPDDEYRPYDEQKKLHDNEVYKIYIMKTNLGEISAFIALWEFSDFLFIEHFAVEKSHRNNGLGSLIIKEICDLSSKMMCLEVEPPENEISKRRIEFYRRNGLHLNTYPYIQPTISNGKKPVPLMIMTSKEVDEEEFKRIKDKLYKDVYNVL